ncbi:MutS-related protein [Myroides sp. LJL116]
MSTVAVLFLLAIGFSLIFWKKINGFIFSSISRRKINQGSREYPFTLIRKYYLNNKAANAFQSISDEIWSDLDLEDIYMFIDRTNSKIGQQYLYFKMRTIESVESLAKFNKIKGYFSENLSVLDKSKNLLKELDQEYLFYYESLFSKEQASQVLDKGVFRLLMASSICVVLVLLLAVINPKLLILLLPLYCINMYFHYQNKQKIFFYLNGIKALNKVFAVYCSLVKNEQLTLLVDRKANIEKIKGIVNKTFLFSPGGSFVGNEFLTIIWYSLELIKILFNIEYLFFYLYRKALKGEHANLKAMYCYLAEVDCAISTVEFCKETDNLCSPVFASEKSINIQGLYHPLLVNGVSNDLILKETSLMLTGSNMSGKTTFIRAFAINAILAETLGLVFARSYSAPFSKIFTSIRISDDLSKGSSYYFEELNRLKFLIDTSQEDHHCFFILDELFKGTNTIERISGGVAVLNYLNNAYCTVLVSTHDLELAEYLESKQYDLYYFDEKVLNGELIYDYKLKRGVVSHGNAIELMKRRDFPSIIIKEATQVKQTLVV